MRVYESIVDSVGNTPLVRIQRVVDGANARVLVKMESRNPLGSVKDRIAAAMVEAAEKDGLLKPGGTLVESTSGNTGIGLAFVAAAKGYKLILTMPESMSIERRRLLAILGAEVVLTPAKGGMPAAIQKAEELAKEIPGAFLPGQFDNPANPGVHYRTTGPEIWRAAEGEVDVFVTGVGTGGTVTGVGRYLKEHNPEIQVIAVEPEDSPVLSGGKPGGHKIQGIGAGFIPEVLDQDLLDDVVTITAAEAGAMAKRLAREEGILCGISAGGNVAAAVRLAQLPENEGKTIVTLICDTGERYLSTWLFEDDK
ncbi:MAG: cysteine synthase A [Victivallales bacterium]|jgi:cysteine synthase|nr:cysteine synthase A [Victivallales bacterium]MBT7301989.1 cysteine synthase A [Victivallales bacterium]